MKWCELTILVGASSLSDVSNVIYSSLCHVQQFYLGIFKRGDIESFHRIDPEFERVCFSFPMVEYIVKAHAWGEIYDK